MRTAVIIGAGPAGLTAAHELAHRTDVTPLVLEASQRLGGLSCTVEHAGNRIDIGGHRFFSKSDRVMRWWLDRMPLEHTEAGLHLAYKGADATLDARPGPDPTTTDRVMLARERRSRILWRGELFDYPLSASWSTLSKLGFAKAGRAGLSYGRALLDPIEHETTLEHFLINRFGRDLYHTFFKTYTEKVWGVACSEISADWGAQRIKGLSIRSALRHALTPSKSGDLGQQGTETSLIERFLYPKYGPGQMWEVTAAEVTAAGGEVRTGQHVERVHVRDGRVVGVDARDAASGAVTRVDATHVISSMPVPHLVDALDTDLPAAARATAGRLRFRDFMTVGLLVDRMEIEQRQGHLDDNWIYIQEPGVHVGRLQIFNNWSPWMVADPDTRWLGLEYFCSQGDALWSTPDADLVALAGDELERLGIARRRDVLDGTVLRVPKAYPAYTDGYADFDVVRTALDQVDGLHCVGRNGQHRYNNQDHSMLTAMHVVDGIAAGATRRDRVWDVNTEQEYLEATG